MWSDLIGSNTAQLELGLMQAASAAALCIAVVMACRWYEVSALGETAVSLIRGLAQMILAGIVLAVLLTGSLLVGALILLAMTGAAAATAAKRAAMIDGAFLLCFVAIAAGAAVAIAAMLASGTLSPSIAVLVPIGSMIIANAMNACAQASERFRSECLAHVGQIEARLSLGASPAEAVAPFLRNAVYASLLPRLDMLKSLGLVWIPGVMAGMMVSGASPVYAGIYQFVIVAMILAAAGVTGLVTTILLRSKLFSQAEQFVLRPDRLPETGQGR
jgi:putative ABC transport system permease protein